MNLKNQKQWLNQYGIVTEAEVETLSDFADIIKLFSGQLEIKQFPQLDIYYLKYKIAIHSKEGQPQTSVIILQYELRVDLRVAELQEAAMFGHSVVSFNKPTELIIKNDYLTLPHGTQFITKEPYGPFPAELEITG